MRMNEKKIIWKVTRRILKMKKSVMTSCISVKAN